MFLVSTTAGSNNFQKMMFHNAKTCFPFVCSKFVSSGHVRGPSVSVMWLGSVLSQHSSFQTHSPFVFKLHLILWLLSPLSQESSELFSVLESFLPRWPKFQLVRGVHQWNHYYQQIKVNGVCQSHISYTYICKAANSYRKGWIFTRLLLHSCVRIFSVFSTWYVKKEVPICC